MTARRRKPAPAQAPKEAPNPAPFAYGDYIRGQAILHAALTRGPVYTEVTGASGMGKSSLLRDLTESLDRHLFQTVYLSSSCASLTNVARFLAHTVRVAPKRTHLETVQALVEVLTTQPARLVVLVDEADRVRPEALHELRVLAECHKPGMQLFSVLLSGLPELRQTLDGPTLFPLKRRISVRVRLNGLKRDELNSFLEHRFSAEAERIPEQAMEALFERSRATPGIIDKVVWHALQSRPGKLYEDDVDAALDLFGA